MRETCIVCGGSGTPCVIAAMEMRRCPSCGFLWLAEKILGNDYYDRLDIGAEEGKTLRRKRNIERRVGVLRRFIPLDGTCDIGTGAGLFLQVLRERRCRDCWGVEPSASGVQYARSLGLDVERGTIHDIPALLRKRNVGVFALFHVVEHLDDPARDIRLLRDALPDGGYLVIETPNVSSYSARTLKDDWEFFYPEHLWYFDDRTLPRFLEQRGFTILMCEPVDFDMEGKSTRELLCRLGLPAPKILQALAFPIRAILARLVQRLGRLDSIWIIAWKQSRGDASP